MIPHRTILSGFRPSVRPSVRPSPPPLDLKSCLSDHKSDLSDLKSGLSDLKSDLSDLKSGLSEFGIRKPEKIILCGIIGHLPLRGRCPSTIYYITTYTNRGASGTADHVTLLRLFFPFSSFCVNPCKAASFTGRCCFQRRQIKDILLSMDSKDETPFLPRSRLFHPIDMNLSLSSTPFPDSFPPLPNSFPPLHSLTPFLFSFPTSPFAHTLSLLTLPF